MISTKRRVLSATIAGIVAAVTLAACSGSPGAASDSNFGKDASGSLHAWGFNSTDEVGKARLAYAKKQLDGVQITIDQTNFDAQKFATRLASGNVPDVVQMDAQLVATFAAQGLILPLDKCYSAHGDDPASMFYPSVKNDVTYDGKIWGIPQFYQPPAIMLNMRVLKRAGVTADQIDTSKPDELIAAATKMYQASGGKPTTLGFDPVATGQAGLWILGYGGQLIDSSGKPTLDDASNQKGLEVLKRIYDAQGGFAADKSFTDAFDTFGKGNPFSTDKVGAQVVNQWYVNVLTPYTSTVDLGAVPFRGPDGKPFTVASGQAFVIPAGAKNKDAGCAWALSLVSTGAWDAAGAARAKTVASTAGAINTGLFTGSPKVDSSLRSTYVKASGNAGFDQAIDTFYDVVGSGRSIGTSPAGQEIQTGLQDALQAVLLGQKSPQAALAAAQQDALRAYDRAVKDAGH